MRMSVKQLRAFLAVAHTLNFAHASERLNLSQPALSLTIKGLEEALGGALLQRSTRKVTLTQEGELFLPMARQLLADWDNVEEAMRQSFTLQRGKISVAAMPSFAANVLPEALKAFRDRYAGVNVTVHDVINEQVIEMVREGRVEMGIAFEPSPNHNLLFTPLAVDRFVAIVPQQSPLAKKKQLTWQELLTLDFITLQRPSAVRLMLEEALARSGRWGDWWPAAWGAARYRRCVKRRWHRWAPSASRSAIRRLRSASARSMPDICRCRRRRRRCWIR